ncbi:DUF4249 domain-containing protein [Mucilaginibacter gotjawali]|uniref:DUF4249 domain-containing protein n=2 Tax=Mucilaginibacter gotjawali TaxID=1550579 RepID=A0A839SCG1_9SPHI|nr:DUF4249 domain-containing protein [Mucilaginibacter gotjawali]MBB3054379.1 hypothetical protein [Mucilaginibacter gotjawali]
MTNCKKQISSAAIAAPNNYLVVNGNIAVGDSTTISLSRTVNLSGKVNSNPELNAKVSIEGSQGGNYSLTASKNGNYVSAALNLSSSQTYRLKIVTADGKQYASDFVPVKNSPPIDTINYAIQSNGIQVKVNTHDPANNTHYYRWEYTETYIIHSMYYSNYMEVNHDTTAIRPADKQIYQCWVSDTSSTIVLGSSAKLAQDIISEQPVIAIPSSAEKLHIRYSIMLKQYALTTDAFNYFTLLKKNTEQLGSIFDAQPSELSGNIHCLSNPAEPVIGYVTVGAVAKQRIFIDNKDLPAWTPDLPGKNCQLDTLRYVFLIPKSSPPQLIYYVKEYIYTDAEIPIDIVGSYPDGGFTAAFPYCVDCTLRGVNKPPSFWK